MSKKYLVFLPLIFITAIIDIDYGLVLIVALLLFILFLELTKKKPPDDSTPLGI